MARAKAESDEARKKRYENTVDLLKEISDKNYDELSEDMKQEWCWAMNELLDDSWDKYTLLVFKRNPPL